MTKNLNALFLVTLIFATLSEIRADVLVGPILFEESKYFLLTNSTWTEAEQEAQRMGGHLATIETVEENIFVFRTFSEYDNVERNLWIGLNDFLIEGLFLWSSGTISEYENFAPGEPTNLFDEDFVHIWYPSVINPDGCWNNAPDIINISNRPCHGVVELPFLLGDVNQDGAVDLLDVEPFVELLSSEKFLLEADINKDGIVDLLDVGPFVDLLLNS